MSTTMKLAAICMLITLVCIIGGMWWWAVLGLASEVGKALAVTAFSAFIVGIGFGMANL